MRHAIAGNRLGRHPGWRKATIRDIAKATLIRQRVTTTKAMAKEARKMVDHLITLGKKGTLSHRRYAFAILCNHQLVSDLFNKIAIRFRGRTGGYTRIIPLSQKRRGDNAQMVLLELTEIDEAALKKDKKIAVAKAKKSAPPKVAGKPVEEQELTKSPEELKPTPKPAPSKEPDKKHKPSAEKTKSGKKIVGGIRKIFQRKTTDS